MLIDTHAHLYWDSFALDLDAVLQRAIEANISTIINIGTDFPTSQQAVNQIDGIDRLQVFATSGLHPDEAFLLKTPENIDQEIKKIEELIKKNPKKIIAIGECGLDYHFDPSSLSPKTGTGAEIAKEIQLKLFKSQIILAKKLNLPIVIHCRDAWEDIFLEQLNGTRGVFHTFTGTRENAREAIRLGYYLSFSCIVTYPKNDHLRQTIQDTSLDKILSETDCPFLPPQQIRGQRNEPANIQEVIRIISEIKNISFDKVSDQITENAKALFQFS